MKSYTNLRLTSLLAVLLLLPFATFAQAPSNDDPCDAEVLTVGTECNLIEYTNLDATSFGGENPGCGFYQGSEVWFEVTVPASGKLIVDLNPGTNTQPMVAFYTGTCAAPSLYDCDAGASANGGNVGRITINDISQAGQTYLVAVFRRSNATGGTFEICAWEPTIPDNDLCANAVPLIVNSSCSFTEYTNANCTDDDESINASCGFDNGADVWFIVTVPASGKMIIDLNPGSNPNPQLAMFQGTCGSFTQFACNSSSSQNGGNVGRITINDPAVANETMYVKVWRRASVQGGTFEICAWEPVTPINDFCADAINISVDTECNFTEYTNLNATDGDEPINSSCGFDQGADVWFTLTIPTSGKMIVDLNPGTNTTPQVALFQGNCGSFTQYACNSSASENGGNVGRITINDFSVGGQTMYVKVWRRASQDGGTFEICAWEPFIPDNDLCANAIEITVGDTCSFTEYTNLHTTDLDETENAPCGFDQGADVWFTIQIPTSGQLIIDLNPGSNTSPQVALFQGTCGSFTDYACDSNRSLNGGNVGRITINDPNVGGEVMYIKVWRRASTQGGTFEICAWEPPIPENDLCDGAIELTVQGVECNLQTYTNLHSTDSEIQSPVPNTGCGFYFGADVWFKATIPSDGQLILDLGPLDFNNVAMSVYTGTCGDFTLYECDDSESENGGFVGKIIIADLTLADEEIYIRVWRRASVQGGDFQICAFNPTFCGFFDVIVEEQGACNPLNENYTQEVTFSYLNSPAIGNVNVNGQVFALQPSPMTVTLVGLPSNNEMVDLNIYFEDEPDCFYLDDNAWFAPICCEGDANFDGQVNVLDLIAISSDFGCVGDCVSDVNVDGTVNILDLIAVSSNFGNNCLD